MCGICGILGNGFEKHVAAMGAAMHHRGPNDSGICSDEYISFGHRRLSIIDVSSQAHQPMTSRDKLVWIIYNGETYNFIEEREFLLKKGYSFNSSSDTEVLLNMYLEYGEAFVQRLRGMFALAIYDKRQGPGPGKLLLARDHLGVKPLLYSQVGNTFLFASEIKALLASGLIGRNIDPEALRMLLTYGSIPQPKTILRDVAMLLPGHILVIEGGRKRIEPYWHMKQNPLGLPSDTPYPELVRLVRSELERVVKMQMVSDVPLGAFLSSGVDSTLLVALLTKASARKVKTFSVGFEAEGSPVDETVEAGNIAAFLGTDHQKVLITGNDVRESIFKIASALDQPSVDGVNSYFVSSAARLGATVSLSGTGGDELFAGYPWFSGMQSFSRQTEKPTLLAPVRSLAAKVFRNPMFNPFIPTSFGRYIERFRATSGFLPRYCREYQIYGPAGAAHILSPGMRRKVLIGREPALDFPHADEIPAGSPVSRVSALCLRTYTQNQLLRDIDAVSMSHSLEVRVPFLDHRLLELALSLPDSAKLSPDLPTMQHCQSYRQSGAKRILFDAGKTLLPPDFDLQIKKGFAMPFGSWLHGPLREIFNDTLSQSSVSSRGLFDVQETERVKKAFFSGQIAWPQPWLLMITELWCRTVLDTSSSPAHP